MKTIYRFLCTAALLGPGALLSYAIDPVAPATGKVLVVDDRHTMEGDIEHVADQYRIRHGGGETWLPANKALRLCASYQEALAYLRTQANLDDPDEHLRLALWCRDRKLSAEALAEVRRAAELVPKDSDVRGKGVEASPRAAAIKSLLMRLESDQRTGSASKPTGSGETEQPIAPLAIDLTAESMGQFITHIQPILMNSCASCHANSRTNSSFRLMHTADIGSRKATQQNLAAVLAQVNINQPQASPFLSKALGVHGEMAQAPFKNRESAAFRTLESWVGSTIAANPRLREVLPPPPPPAPVIAAAPQSSSSVAFGESRFPQPGGTTEAPMGTTTNPNVKTVLPASTQPNETPTAPGSDAYDPDEFNRANHPQSPTSTTPQQPPQTPARPGVR